MNKPKKKSNNKILLWFFLIFFCFLFVIALSLPIFISSQRGKTLLLNYINSRRTGTLKIEDISLSWFHSQSIKGIHWNDEKRQRIFYCEKITSSAPLWTFIFSKRNIGETKLFSPQLEITPDFSAPSIIQPMHPQTAGFVPQIKTKSGKVSFYGNIEVLNGSLSFSNKEITKVSFKNIEAQVNVPKEILPIHFAIIGTTSQEQVEGKFNIKAEIQSTQISKPLLDIQAKLTHFPIRGIDEVCGYFNPRLKGLILETIGPSIDLDLEAKFQEVNKEIQLSAQSALITVQIQAQSQSKILTLKEPSQLTLTLTPQLIEKIASQFPHLSFPILTNSPKAQLTLSQLSLPSIQGGFDYSSMTYSALFSLSDANFSSQIDSSSIQLQVMKISAAKSGLNDHLLVDAKGNFIHEQDRGQLFIQGDIEKWSPKTFQGSAKIKMEQFPLIIVDHLLSKSPKFQSYLGKHLDAELSLNLNANAGQIRLRTQTPNLNIPETIFSIQDQIVLSQPTRITYTPSTALFSDSLQKIQLSALSPIIFNIDQIIIPLENVKNLQLVGMLQLPKMELRHSAKTPLIPIQPVNFQFQANTLQNLEMEIKNPQLNVQMQAAYNEGILQFKKPIHGYFKLSAEHLQKLLLDLDNPFSFTEITTIDFTVDPFALVFDENFYKKVKVASKIRIDQLLLRSEQTDSYLGWKNLLCKMQLDTNKKTFSTTLSAENVYSRPALNLDFSMDHFNLEHLTDSSKTRYQLSADFKELPLNVLELMINKPKTLVPMLGNTLTFSLQSSGSAELQNIAINIDSTSLQMNGAFTLTQHLIELKNAMQIKYTLSKEIELAIDQWVNGWQTVPILFDDQSRWTIILDKLSVPIHQNGMDFSNALISATLNSELLKVKNKNASSIVELSKMQFKINKTNLEDPYSLGFKGFVSMKSTVSNEFSKEGKWNIEARIPNDQFKAGDIDLKMQVQKFPSSLLDLLSPMFGEKRWNFDKILGETCNAELNVHSQNFSGPFLFNFQSPNVLFSFDGRLLDGLLLLNQPIHAQAKLTQDLSKILLKEVNPFSISSIESKHPMTLWIDSKGFSVPLFPMKKEEFMIPHARLELGQVKCNNEGTFNLTLGLLKQNFLKSSDLNLWFTPIDLHIQKGIINLERTEILIDNTLEICTYGTIDLVKSYVDMVLGLTSQCLKKAFGIKDLPPNYVMQIPMKGPIDDVQLDTSKATAKITAILLWQKGLEAGGALKGPAGALAGELLGKLATLPDRNSKAPPPKKPFPWEEKRTSSKNEETNSEPKTHRKKVKMKKKEKPLKQLYKFLKS